MHSPIIFRSKIQSTIDKAVRANEFKIRKECAIEREEAKSILKDEHKSSVRILQSEIKRLERRCVDLTEQHNKDVKAYKLYQEEARILEKVSETLNSNMQRFINESAYNFREIVRGCTDVEVCHQAMIENDKKISKLLHIDIRRDEDD